MDTTQIYTIVNEAALQSMGTNAISVIDTSTLVSLGNLVLSSSVYTDAFINTLALRIERTIFSYRAYRNSNGDMVLSDSQWGAITQKIKVSMPEAEEDETVDLVNGQSVDHYKVNKAKVNQKLFYTRTPYQFHITIQRKWLREAFLNETAMAGFINMVYGQVRNAIELALENLGRACLNNFIAETTNVVNLVSDYNAATGSTVTAANSIFNEAFLRYAISRIKNTSKMLTNMSTRYNNEGEERFTPFEDQRIRILASFETALETQVQYAAFHEQYVGLEGFKEVGFWQAEENPMNVEVKRASDQTITSVDNIVGIIHDRDALGIYKIEEEVLTTPVNAAGSFYNTYWHERQIWINDLSENFVLFTLN